MKLEIVRAQDPWNDPPEDVEDMLKYLRIRVEEDEELAALFVTSDSSDAAEKSMTEKLLTKRLKDVRKDYKNIIARGEEIPDNEETVQAVFHMGYKKWYKRTAGRQDADGGVSEGLIDLHNIFESCCGSRALSLDWSFDKRNAVPRYNMVDDNDESDNGDKSLRSKRRIKRRRVLGSGSTLSGTGDFCIPAVR